MRRLVTYLRRSPATAREEVRLRREQAAALAVAAAVLFTLVTIVLSWPLAFAPRAHVTVRAVVETGVTKQVRSGTCPEALVVVDTPSGVGRYRTCLGWAPYPQERVVMAHRPAGPGQAQVEREDDLPHLGNSLLLGGAVGLLSLYAQACQRWAERHRRRRMAIA